jgi:hypothetical protein
MSVTSRFQLEKPDDAEATLRVTMTVKEWKQVRHALERSPAWTANHFGRSIGEAIDAAEKVFYSRISDDATPQEGVSRD